jgi:hypothetical protein
MNLCEQKNSSEKPCQSLASEDVGNPKLEPRRRRAKQPTLDGQKFSVYALTENGKMRYIGLTSQTLPRRLNQHFQDMIRPNRKEHKTNWLRACKRDGIAVKIKSIRRGLCLESAQCIEKQIIKRLRPQLVNVHEGGSSGYAGLSEEAKQRHSESGKARYRDLKQLEFAKKLSAKMHAASEYYRTPEYLRSPEGRKKTRIKQRLKKAKAMLKEKESAKAAKPILFATIIIKLRDQPQMQFSSYKTPFGGWTISPTLAGKKVQQVLMRA